jgi:hypothetical protein
VAPAAAPGTPLHPGGAGGRRAPAQSTLEVFVEGAAGLPPLLGELRLEGDALSFAPRFALRPGMRYRAVYRDPKQAAPAVALLEVPAGAARPPTALVRIDPSADFLPENLLKFYLHFSAPMSRGEAYRRIRLLDERGAALELPFLEIDQELWDQEARRLTLLFDPGRVKRELVPHQEVGPPLRAGSAYTLVVDRAWPDAHGNALRSEARKTFRVGPPDHAPPRTTDWRLGLPPAGTRAPLVVTFPEPLDRALLERVLDLQDASGDPVFGAVAVDAGETRWTLTPREPWKAGPYTLRAATILEDLAGNSLGRPFEVDVFERVEDRFLDVTENLRFRIE